MVSKKERLEAFERRLNKINDRDGFDKAKKHYEDYLKEFNHDKKEIKDIFNRLKLKR